MTDRIINVQNPERALFSPVWSQRLINTRLRSGNMLYTEAGREVLCHRCGEYWPADTEFFYACQSKPGGLNKWCKACYELWRKQQK